MDHEISIELNTEETTSHNNIVFDIKGNNITGLHKSIINSLFAYVCKSNFWITSSIR